MGKIPGKAQKVFEGVIFDVFQWDQKMFDGTTQTFEMLKRPNTVIILGLTDENQIITIEDEQPNRKMEVMLPGGRVDRGEDHLQAAKREFSEETGYSSDEWELWHTIEPMEKIEFSIFYFVARNAKKTGQPNLDAGEKIKVVLSNVGDFIDDIVSGEHNAYELTPHILKKIIDGERAELEKFLNPGIGINLGSGQYLMALRQSDAVNVGQADLDPLVIW